MTGYSSVKQTDHIVYITDDNIKSKDSEELSIERGPLYAIQLAVTMKLCSPLLSKGHRVAQEVIKDLDYLLLPQARNGN